MLTPPWKGTGRLIESSIRKSLLENSLICEGERVGVALSGGKDSLTLLLMLSAINGRGVPRFSLFALHISGSFSCGAGITHRYLEKICQSLDVPLITREVEQEIETLECYSCSRIRRRELFTAAREQGITKIAFGHHRDDQAQTVMMNLFSKGEFEGMLPSLPMYAYGITLIRPLLKVSEEIIITFAEQQGFLRSMCRCPVGQNSMRKRTEEWMKNIENQFPHAKSNVGRAVEKYGTKKAATPPKERILRKENEERRQS